MLCEVGSKRARRKSVSRTGALDVYSEEFALYFFMRVLCHSVIISCYSLFYKPLTLVRLFPPEDAKSNDVDDHQPDGHQA